MGGESNWTGCENACFIFCCNCARFSQTDADPEVCKKMCRVNEFEAVLSLVSYYQMVSRSRQMIEAVRTGTIMITTPVTVTTASIIQSSLHTTTALESLHNCFSS